MGIKVNGESAISYPCLMVQVANAEVVLFTSYGCGTVVKDSPCYPIYDRRLGFASSEFPMDAYEIYNGSITLENS